LAHFKKKSTFNSGNNPCIGFGIFRYTFNWIKFNWFEIFSILWKNKTRIIAKFKINFF